MVDLHELRLAIRRMLASKNPSAYPLWKVLKEELGARFRPRIGGGKPFTKDDPRRNKLPNEK